MNPAEAPIAGRTIASRNPATGEVLATFPCATDAEVEAAVAVARKAQAEWHTRGVRARLEVLRRFQQLLLERKQEVAELIAREAGKPVAEAITTEIVVTLDSAEYCLKHVWAYLRPERVRHANLVMRTRRGTLLREPYGVIGIITPWNYPFSIPASESIAALALGNAVVLKPSEFTPQIALAFAALLHEAGVPSEVFSVVLGDGPTGAALVGSAIHKLIFTGSVATGRRVGEAAAARLLPCVLELGGKDPAIVLEDADLDSASSGIVWGAFVNAGQTCLSIERCYVHEKVYDRFVQLCVEKTKKLRVGAGTAATTDVGPLIHESQVRIVESQVQAAVAAGARVLCGGDRLPRLGPNFYAPTVLVDVNHSMRLMREETFGPVLPIMKFSNEATAVMLANDSQFGLAASIWTRNRRRAERLARQIAAGTVMVNDAVASYGVAEAPHGGYKLSGIGATHGRFGFDELVRVKYVNADRMPSMKRPWWYGYGPEFTGQMRDFADLLFAPPRRRLKALRGTLSALFRARL